MISATFSLVFSGFWARLGSCFMDFSGFNYFFMDFSGSFAGLGELFWEFQQFQLLFWRIFRQFRWVRGAVLVISAVSATFSCSFPDFWRDFGCCFANFCGFSSTRPACYAINLWLLYIMIIEKSSIF